MRRLFFALFVTVFSLVVFAGPADAYRVYSPTLDEFIHVQIANDIEGDSPRISPRGNYGVESNEEERLESGFSFMASRRSTGVGNGSTRTMLVSNPDTSTRNAVGMILRANATGKMELDVFEDVTVDTNGNNLIAKNANLGADTPSVVNVTTDGTYSGLGESMFESIVPGGGTGGLQIGGESQASTFYLPPGHNLLLRATNTSGGGEDLVLNLKWIEF